MFKVHPIVTVTGVCSRYATFKSACKVITVKNCVVCRPYTELLDEQVKPF